MAVDHVNLQVRQGEVFGFLGPNSAGKTTTQRMLTTLLEPTEGRIVTFGHDLAHEAYPVKRQMGLVPEESNVYTELTAWENQLSDPKDTPKSKIEPPPPTCRCVQDPFASLPPKLQPKNKTWKTGFRQVICPGCGLKYWTNCEGDLCMDCQKKGIRFPKQGRRNEADPHSPRV